MPIKHLSHQEPSEGMPGAGVEGQKARTPLARLLGNSPTPSLQASLVSPCGRRLGIYGITMKILLLTGHAQSKSRVQKHPAEALLWAEVTKACTATAARRKSPQHSPTDPPQTDTPQHTPTQIPLKTNRHTATDNG